MSIGTDGKLYGASPNNTEHPRRRHLPDLRGRSGLATGKFLYVTYTVPERSL